MKVLILGGNGMVGSNLYFALKKDFEIYLTLRRSNLEFSLKRLNISNCIFNIKAEEIKTIESALDILSTGDVVINCIGVTKQIASVDIKDSIYINALFPHLLYELTFKGKIRLIHFSTDCVFSGSQGFYDLKSQSDATDIYGKTKSLGEIHRPLSLTLRKSTIGLEMENAHGLIEWWLSQKGLIEGYDNAIYSGIIGSELGNVLKLLIEGFPHLEGLYNLASIPISKYDLLKKLQRRLGREDIEIAKNTTFYCDRSLNGSEFSKITGYEAPSWDEMIGNLSKEIEDRNKQNHV